MSKKKSRSRYILLGILSVKPGSGYDLKQTIERSTAFFWNESFGQIYPTLAALKKEKLVTAKKETKGRGRIVYSITKAGKKVLSDWLAEPYAPVIVRNEMLLKVFFSNFAEENVLGLHIERAIAEAEQYSALLKSYHKELSQNISDKKQRLPYEAVAEYGILDAETFLQWGRTQLDKWKKLKNKKN